MNLFGHFQTLVRNELSAMMAAGELKPGLDVSRVTAEPPRDASHGDVTTNAAMVVAKPAGMAPKVLAETLAKRLAKQPDVLSAEVAGPGFINLRLRETFWPKILSAILELGDTYGHSELGKGIKTNVEYVSANPTGPLARRPLPRRGVWRCPGCLAQGDGLRRQHRILHQRCRRPG